MKFLDPQKGLGKVFCSIEPMTLFLGGSALASAGGNIFSSIFGSSAANKQANAIKEAAETARRTALELDDRQRADVAPFRKTGLQANDLISQIISGEANLDDVLSKSSLFQWQQQEGERTIDRQLASRGLYNSGMGMETLARFNNQLVADEGMRYWDRLFNTMKVGADVSSRTASNTTGIGSTLLNSQAQLGLAEAGSIGDATRSLAQIGPGVMNPIVGGIGTYMQYDLYKPMLDKLGQASERPRSVMDERLFSDPADYAFQGG